MILDFGCWSPGERYAIRAVAQLAHADFMMEYVTIPEPERRVAPTGFGTWPQWASHRWPTLPRLDA